MARTPSETDTYLNEGATPQRLLPHTRARQKWNVTATMRLKDTKKTDGDAPHGQGMRVAVRETLDVKIETADASKGFVVLHNGHLRTLEHGLHAQDGVVRLVSGRCELRTCPHREAERRLLPTIHLQTSSTLTADGRAKLSRRAVSNMEFWHGEHHTKPTCKDSLQCGADTESPGHDS